MRSTRDWQGKESKVLASWTDEETFKLIELWSKDSIQGMLEGSRRNRDVYAKIAKNMNEAGYEKTVEQCAGKIKKLKFEYRRIRDSNSRTGRGRTEWKFLDAIDNVLGHKPTTQPPVVV